MISLGQLCNESLQFMLHKNKLNAFKNEKLILQGNRNHSGNVLWYIIITRQNKSKQLKAPTEVAVTKQTPSTQSMDVILRRDKTAQDLLKYFHAACFSPTSKD